MTEERVHGYRMVNMNVNATMRNHLLVPLIACLVTINNLLDALSQFLSNFIFYFRRAVPKASASDYHEGYYQVSASRTLGVNSEHRSKPIDTTACAMNENDAKIISPEGLSGLYSTSYVLLFENEEQSPLPISRQIPRALSLSAFRVINIAVGLGDRRFFETLRFLHHLKGQSLKQNIRLFFSFSRYRVDLVKVECVQDSLYWSVADHNMEKSRSRDIWMMPQSLVSSAELEHRFNFPRYSGNDKIATNHIPQRRNPLSENDLLSELQSGPIYGLALTKQRSLVRLLLLLVIFIFLAGSVIYMTRRSFPNATTTALAWSITFFSTIVAWKFRALSEDQPVQVGSIRFRFSCRCGEAFLCDIKQSELNLAPLAALLQPRSGTREHIGEVTRPPHSVPPESEPYQGASLTNDADKKLRHAGDKNVRLATSQQDASKPNQSQKNDPRTEEDLQDTCGNNGAEVKLFLIVCFPHHSRREMWQTRITEINDHRLIKGVKKTYHLLRPFWRRLGGLRSFSNIRLARFELSHTIDGPLINDIEWKWPEIEDKDWESVCGDSQGVPVDGISKLMVHLWVSQGSSKDSDHVKKNPEMNNATSSTGRKHRVPRIEICGPRTTQTLPVEENQVSSSESRWINRMRLVRIYFPDQNVLRATNPETDEQMVEWLQTAGIDVDLGTVDPQYIFQKTPKKRREPLCIDPNGRVAPIGWGIWIDEDFYVPWYLLLISGVFSFGILIFAVFYTFKHGPSANGWTIGGFMFAPLNMLLTIWVLKTKDSKHPRS